MKKSKLPIIIGCVLVLFVIVGVVLFLVLKNDKVTITFIDEEKVVSTQKVKKGEKVTLPEVKKEGYTFEGWYYKDIKVNEGVWFKEDATLVSHWLKEDAATMNITFDSNGGNKLETMTIECETELKLPTPTRDGYKFISWLDKNDAVISNETKLACENIALTAKWEKVEEQKQESKKEENKPSSNTSSSKKEYTCPNGYILDGTKCTITVDATKYCGTNEILIGNNCYGSRRDVTRCNYQGKYAYSQTDHIAKCFYDETDNYMYKTSCEASGNYWIDGLCYTRKENVANICESTWTFIDAHQIPGYGITPNIQDGCYQKRSLQYKCEDNTYTLNGDKCTKTIDATLK